jgi:ubiquinone/menaquinone biosynthesis C-methylase UbiE
MAPESDDDYSKNDYSEIINYYDSIAVGYDELHFEEQKQKFNVLKDALRLGKSTKSMKMLDVGCGTFFSCDYFRELADISGIEPSSKMVDLFVQAHQGDKARIKVGLAEEIEDVYGKDKFDFLICVSVAHHFKQPKAAFRAMAAVCKDSALLGITLLKGVKGFKGLEDAIYSSFFVQNRVDQRKDVVYICRKNHKK